MSIYSCSSFPFNSRNLLIDFSIKNSVLFLRMNRNSMAKRRRKLSPELEKNISLAKKQIELITAIIHDIDEEDIQEEYKSAFLPVMSAYMSLDQMYKDVGFNDDTSNLYGLYLSNLDRFKGEYEL